jgi:hypothetical protein
MSSKSGNSFNTRNSAAQLRSHLMILCKALLYLRVRLNGALAHEEFEVNQKVCFVFNKAQFRLHKISSQTFGAK